MQKADKNRQFIISYMRAISGVDKSRHLFNQYTNDQLLIDQMLSFEELMPAYEIVPDEITTENDRVIVRAHIIGQHRGNTEGILPTMKTIETQVVIGYYISEQKIVNHWFITDKINLMQQLGLSLSIVKME